MWYYVTTLTNQGYITMMKQHTRHFEIAAQHSALGNTEAAIRYLEGMLRSAMSNRAVKEIQAEIAKYSN